MSRQELESLRGLNLLNLRALLVSFYSSLRGDMSRQELKTMLGLNLLNLRALIVQKSTNTDERVDESSIKELRAEIDQLRYSVLLALLVQK